MNVLFIAPFDLRIRDGTTVRVINLVRAAAQVCDTVFLASYTNNEYLKALSNIVHIRLKNIQLRYHLAMAFTSSILTRLASKFLTRFFEIGFEYNKNIYESIDIIHVHWLLFSYLAKYIQTLSPRWIPLIVDLHGSYRIQEPLNYSMKNILLHTLGLLHETTTIRDSSISAFTVPSSSFGEFVKSAYGIDSRKVFVVPDVVEPEVLASAKECNDKGAEELLGERIASRGVVAYVGTVSKYHGFFDLVEAFRIAKRSYKDLNLLLIVPSLQQLAKLGRFLPEETVVLENVPRRILPCVLRRASVLVLPHRAGTQFDYLPSNKVYDYMLAGRPIVAYRTPAVETALGDYSMRILVEPNNPVELAKGILKAMLLYGDSEPKPAFDKVPLLESAANALERVYHIVTK